MRPDLIEKYDLRVPRYTSYPTAPHFAPTVGADTYARWLGALEVDTPLSLYLHIPYCAEMCWFCGCHTKATHKYAPVGDYLAALWEEMRLVAAALPGRMRVDHVHFGGGSPTLLTAEDFTHTLAELRLLFDVTAEADIAVELDPRTAKQAYIEAMATAGVTRASIGVQDFDERVQRVINRIQPYDVTAQVVTWLRAAGIDAINMDLVYGLPYQTVESVIDMAEKTVEIEPARVALFGYAHVPWMKTHQRLLEKYTRAGADDRFEQAEAAAAAADQGETSFPCGLRILVSRFRRRRVVGLLRLRAVVLLPDTAAGPRVGAAARSGRDACTPLPEHCSDGVELVVPGRRAPERGVKLLI